jgi:hypothetical protein
MYRIFTQKDMLVICLISSSHTSRIMLVLSVYKSRVEDLLLYA